MEPGAEGAPAAVAAADAAASSLRRTGLPPVVLLAYFLISWCETFPITAFQSLLNDSLHLPLSTISSYYAVTYLPYMWKPLFGWLSDNVPLGGYHRIPYITMTALGSAVAQVATAICVRSVFWLFFASFCQAICAAFLQLMVGAFLVDVARRDVGNAAALQGMANAAKWVGTLVAQVMALWLYAGGPARGSAARPAIAGAAAAPALLALMAPLLPEARRRRAAAPALLLPHTAMQEAEVGAETPSSCAVARGDLRYGATIAVVQANFILIGCQNLMASKAWLRAVAASAGVSALLLLALHLRPAQPGGGRCRACGEGSGRGGAREGAGRQLGKEGERWKWVRLCAFCFLANAVPTSSVAVGQLQYAALAPDTYQALGVLASLSSLGASLAFGRGFHRWDMGAMLVVATILSLLVALAPLPFVLAAYQDPRAAAGFLSSAGAWAAASAALGGPAAVLVVLPVDTLVTAVSGEEAVERSSTAFAVLLSFYSLGATAGGLIAAPLLDAMGLDGKSWDALPRWVVYTALARLLLLPMLLLLPRGKRPAELQCHEGGDAPAAERQENEGQAERQALP